MGYVVYRIGISRRSELWSSRVAMNRFAGFRYNEIG
jgi:hypothetical protein